MRNLSRRDFVRSALQFSAMGLLVPPALRGLFPGSGRAFAGTAGAASTLDAPFSGNVLVWINLSGGNDGINTVIPFTDPLYSSLRPNIAIPRGSVVKLSAATALHPAMAPLKPLYDAGKFAVVQGVGYPDMNLSHFRGIDIWFSGSSSNQIIETGWLARFLEASFPDFPGIMPDSPYGLQQADSHRIPLQGARGLAGVIVDDPSTFYYLVNENYPGSWPDLVPQTRGGEELLFLRTLDRQTFGYASAIQTASDQGTNTVVYPRTPLGSQLEIIARLIAGGLETPVFLASESGFDTHASQEGNHADLLASLASSLVSFWADIQNQGLAERVLVMTTSEFGRRVEENGSLGTDHGTAAPHFVLGSRVRGGIYGTNPNLADLDPNGNLLIQNDYRGLIGTVLSGHFGADDPMLQDVFDGAFPNLGFLPNPVRISQGPGAEATDQLLAPRPNPFRTGQTVELGFSLAAESLVSLEVFDAQGRRVATLVAEQRSAGQHRIRWNGGGLSAGIYLVRLETPRRRRFAKVSILS